MLLTKECREPAETNDKMEEEEVEIEDQQEVVAEDETSAETDEVVAEE